MRDINRERVELSTVGGRLKAPFLLSFFAGFLLMYYPIEVAGLKRNLQLFPVSDKVSIAAFILLGDTELTVACAEALLKLAPEFDYMLTAEAKSIPLIH